MPGSTCRPLDVLVRAPHVVVVPVLVLVGLLKLCCVHLRCGQGVKGSRFTKGLKKDKEGGGRGRQAGGWGDWAGEEVGRRVAGQQVSAKGEGW